MAVVVDCGNLHIVVLNSCCAFTALACLLDMKQQHVKISFLHTTQQHKWLQMVTNGLTLSQID